jgi:hypothetical protein
VNGIGAREELAVRSAERGCVVKPPERGLRRSVCSVGAASGYDLDAMPSTSPMRAGDDVLVEELVVGVEATGGLCFEATPTGRLLALPPGRIRPRRRLLRLTTEKYSPDAPLELVSAGESASRRERLRSAFGLPRCAHTVALGCRGALAAR